MDLANAERAIAEQAGTDLTSHQRIAAVISGSAGNLIEWYDFYVYAFTSLYFAAAFFPSGDRTAQLLNVAGIYAAGFLIRPIGGWFFGRYSDRYGRRAGMVLSVILMGAGSLMIALLPTYSSAGALAPLLLLVARIVQGFSTGGQYGAAATYLSEISTHGKRGFIGSFQFITLIGGQLCALLVLFVLQRVAGEAAIRDWAWRVPFVIGAGLAFTVLLLSKHMYETNAHNSEIASAGSLRALLAYPRSLLFVVSLSASGAICLYTFTTYMQKFLVNTSGMTARSASEVMTGAVIVFMCLQPLIGRLSDSIGRRTCLLIYSGGMTVVAVPLLAALSHAGTSPMNAFLLIVASLLVLSFYTSVSGLFKAELFPSHVRALGVGLAHSVAAAVFGGTAEYIALLAKQLGHEALFFWYVAFAAGIAFLTALLMPEPSRAGRL
ncbi:MFS transporter [Sphingomonas lycopersici]|uniref:MFS transporter n=1 Tax=Sphingomonas lycopersici TaxID=2951807 RepID=A0AA41Z9Y9_9SPHN|nr:MFS transporter [Sphingomonas lycopersici]MCW6536730.1 MFS transporter [Sphingomonas lycopersici]